MDNAYSILPYTRETLDRVHRECSVRLNRLATNYNSLVKAVTFAEQQLFISSILVTMCELNECLDYLGRCYLLLNNDTEAYKSSYMGVFNRLKNKYKIVSDDDIDRIIKIHKTRNSYVHDLHLKTRVTDAIKKSFIIIMCDSQSIVNKLYNKVLSIDSNEGMETLNVF